MSVLLPVAVNQVAFLIGRCLGPRLRRSALGQLDSAQRWERALELVDRRGPTAVFAARWITVVLMVAAAGVRTVRTRRRAARQSAAVVGNGSGGHQGSVAGRVSGSAARRRP
jgi:hypothetical protein